MSNQQLTQQALELPLPERVELALALWRSIEENQDLETSDEEREIIKQASKRAAELKSGIVVGRSHEQVMEAARRALACD